MTVVVADLPPDRLEHAIPDRPRAQQSNPMNLFMQTAATLALSIGLTAAARATTTTITFDPDDPIGGLPAGSVLGSQYAASGVTFVPNFFAGAGGPTGDWATNTDMTIVTVGSSAAGSVGTP